MILLIDNYDSFVFNLARYFKLLGQETHVVRNDRITAAEARQLRPDGIVISPGPCAPSQAGASLDTIRQLHRDFPMLGVCLGHQALAEAMGGRIVRATEPIHGRTSEIVHDGARLFQGIPSPMQASRYHSLVVDKCSLPAELQVSARTSDGIIMALHHRELPLYGVQFHPESILTEHGFPLLRNFLELAGVRVPAAIPRNSNELLDQAPAEVKFEVPVTF